MSSTWNDPGDVVLDPVGGHQSAAGDDDPGQFGQDAALILVAFNVVEHLEGGRAREVFVGEPKSGGVTEDDLDVGPVHPVGQGTGQIRIDLDGGEMVDPGHEDVSGETGAGADFEDPGTEVDASEGPGQDDVLDRPAPLGAGAVLEVEGVHEVAAVRPGKGGG